MNDSLLQAINFRRIFISSVEVRAVQNQKRTITINGTTNEAANLNNIQKSFGVLTIQKRIPSIAATMKASRAVRLSNILSREPNIPVN
ncbi:MAG: hypothetical protein ABSD73_02740 [Candidatus Bathyarchaeia archaeon]